MAANQGAFSKDALAAQNYKEFILLYNKISQMCFQHCVNSLNENNLTEDEIKCTEKCSGKMVNVNHRLMAVFMEIGPPVDKQLGLTGSGVGLPM